MKRKKIAAVFAFFTFIVGFLLLDMSSTGNVVLNGTPSFDITSLIGLLLIVCSAILTLYTVRKR
jgi:hypothetical protein